MSSNVVCRRKVIVSTITRLWKAGRAAYQLRVHDRERGSPRRGVMAVVAGLAVGPKMRHATAAKSFRFSLSARSLFPPRQTLHEHFMAATPWPRFFNFQYPASARVTRASACSWGRLAAEALAHRRQKPMQRLEAPAGKIWLCGIKIP